MSMNEKYKDIVPLFNRAIVKVKVVKEKTQSGIILAQETIDKKQNNMSEGEIIGLGPECDKSLKLGMLVSFGRYSGATIFGVSEKYDEHLVILNDEDLYMAQGEYFNE